MVKNEKQHSEKTRAQQGSPADSPEPYKIAASTPFDFGAKNLTAYGGLFPVATMLEVGHQQRPGETFSCDIREQQDEPSKCRRPPEISWGSARIQT